MEFILTFSIRKSSIVALLVRVLFTAYISLVPGPSSTLYPGVIILGAIFWWYKLDAADNGIPTSFGLDLAMILVVSIALPYYLIRYKGWRRALISFGKCLGFLVLCACVLALGEVLKML